MQKKVDCIVYSVINVQVIKRAKLVLYGSEKFRYYYRIILYFYSTCPMSYRIQIGVGVGVKLGEIEFFSYNKLFAGSGKQVRSMGKLLKNESIYTPLLLVSNSCAVSLLAIYGVCFCMILKCIVRLMGNNEQLMHSGLS